MTTRYWIKDLSLMNTLQGISSNFNWYSATLEIFCTDWDQLTLLQQTTATTQLTLNGYQFDHDDP